MERLEAMMATCEALVGATAAPSGAAAGASATTGGGCSNVAASLAAAATKRPMEKLVAAMAFCEAPFDGTFDGTTSAQPQPPSGAAAAAGGRKARSVVASLDKAAKKWRVERLVAAMAFCEAPFDGTFDGTASAPSSGGAGGRTNAPEGGAGCGEEDAAALRRACLAGFKKEMPTREHPLLRREKAGSGVDGLAIFETVGLQ